MKPDRPIPSPLAQRFLRWFIKDELAEEVLGDLEEQYDAVLESRSSFQAKLNYWYQVFHYLRPFAIRNFKSTYSNPTLMFRHNFIISFRHFKRYKSTFLINLMGLSSGLACALLIYLWVSDELSIDKFHKNDSQLFQVMVRNHRSDGIAVIDNTPGPLAEGLADEMPEITSSVTASWTEQLTLSVEEKNVRAAGQYVGKNFFHIFSYDLVQGDANQVLTDKSAIVISEGLALKLFNSTENIIGKIVEVEHEKQYQISGVFEGTPVNSSEQFDFLLPFEVFKEKNQWATDWGAHGPRTYATIRAGTNIEQFNLKIGDYLKKKSGDPNIALFVRPYSDKYLYGKYENGEPSGGRIEYVRLFSIIALFILLIACINFMNLSTARASRRLKEVGLKKAIGAGRSALVSQYLGESLLVAFLSLTMALLMIVLFLPQFNEITGKQLSLHFSLTLMYSVLGVTLLTGLLAGSYPALYLSGFGPISILKGKISTSVGEVWTRKGLVVLQFAISVILIVSVLVIYKQIKYVQSTNLGYDKDNVVFFPRVGKNLESFLAEVNTLPGIVKASSIGHSMLGYYSSTGSLQWEGKSPDDNVSFEIVPVNHGMLEMLDIEMKEGRAFSDNFRSDSTAILFNEAAVEVMGLKDPVGKVVKLWDEDRQIIGVVKNFHFTSLHENVVPTFILLAPENTWNVMARIEAGRERETLDQLQQLHQEYYPGFPFDYQFLDEKYQALYIAEQRVATLSQYFAVLAILISCLGLFGLAAFTAERRLKEIGIRKILGSSNLGIVYLLSRDFTRMVGIAILIALPVSYVLSKHWLQGFAYRIDLAWWYFAGAGLAALLIAWFTVGLQTIKAARVNPSQCLKDE